ncbi:MAG TPA: tetratricopeptide repeat protein, partial [Albitalea sp.]|nr:tetratricopeptide repeat protein [Albitalea sp.]
VLVPRSDAEVIETLPAAAGSRAEERRLRQELAVHPRDAATAVALARRYLDQARSQGDPRPAGQALALLNTWPDPAQAPDEVLLMVATIEQYLHQFDASASHLEQLVARRPQHAQAWLTLATVRRVQGRYAESDRACTALVATGAALYAQACQAENDGLRGDFDAARARLRQLLASRPSSDSKNWLLTTLAELEARAGRAGDAEAAYRRALAAAPDGYTVMSYADFLMQQGRHADALAQLKGQPRTDAVLLRLAIAGTRAQSPDAPRDAGEMRERMALANLRPEARTTHAREQAMFALWVDAVPQRALQLARDNVRQQREPLDLLVLAQAARTAGEPGALRDAAAIRNGMGLHDQRLDALL